MFFFYIFLYSNTLLSEQPPLQRAPRRAGVAALQQQHHAGGRLPGEVRLRGERLLPLRLTSGLGASAEEDRGALARW